MKLKHRFGLCAFFPSGIRKIAIDTKAPLVNVRFDVGLAAAAVLVIGVSFSVVFAFPKFELPAKALTGAAGLPVRFDSSITEKAAKENDTAQPPATEMWGGLPTNTLRKARILDFDNSIFSKFLTPSLAGVQTESFRISDLDLRDPHIFVSFIGCQDITDTQLGGFSINNEIQNDIQFDTDLDGFLNTSYVLQFEPLDTTQATMPFSFGTPDCTGPLATTVCGPLTGQVIETTATSNSTGQCLPPLTGTLRPYTPGVVTPSAPCFVSNLGVVTIDLGGIPLTLSEASIGATLVGSPTQTLVNGVLRGFLSESTANNTIIPATMPLIGGKPLSEILPGGTPATSPNCAPHSDKDVHNGVTGWWFYFNFSASRVFPEGSVPEINIQGNGQNIADGGLDSPSLTNHTDFGTANVTGGTVTRTFTIQNLGDANLSLTGSPTVSITGSNQTIFAVTAFPSTTIAPGGSTQFQITFDPSFNDVVRATVVIATNDSDENSYTFRIQGTGQAAAACAGANIIADGGFEAGPPWPAWTIQTSTNFDTPICHSSSCFTSSDELGPRTGSNWLWFGGALSSEEATAGQTVVIPPTANELRFWMRTPLSTSGDLMRIRIDGAIAQSFASNSFNNQGDYTERVLDIGSYADGSPHTVVFEYEASSGSNFVIDDISLTSCSITPEINVQGNGQTIFDGDVSPDPADHTNLGDVVFGTGSVTRTFTIQNEGPGTLNLTDTSPFITISGPFAQYFTVSQPPSPTIAPGGSTTFDITYTPQVFGTHDATISFGNNDPNENPFNFSIRGTGVNAHFRTAGAGPANWESTATWEQSNDGGNTWGPATATPTAANSDFIVIRSGHEVFVAGSITLDQVLVVAGTPTDITRLQLNNGSSLTLEGFGGITTEANTEFIVSGNVTNNAQVLIGGEFILYDVGAVLEGNSINYALVGSPKLRYMQFEPGKLTSDFEFATIDESGPRNVYLSDGSSLTLHAPRTIPGTLGLEGGTFTIGNNLTMGLGSTVRRAGANAALNGTLKFQFNVNLEYAASVTTGTEMPESENILQNLTIEGTSNVTLARNATVRNTLNLGAGTITTGANTLSLVLGVTLNRSTGYVIGNFKKAFYQFAPSVVYEVGSASGYSPVSVTYGISTPGLYEQTVKATQGAHPNLGGPANALSRYWTLSEVTGPAAITADVSFHYPDGDVPGTADESSFVIQKYSDGAFTQPGGSVDTVENTATVTNVSSFSDWTLAEMGAIGTAPSVTTNAATNVTATAATLNGSVNPNGGETAGWFRYSLQDPGACNDTFGTRAPATGGSDLGSGSVTVPFSQGLTGLMPQATVFYCAIAQNSAGTSFGAVLSFTPQNPNQPPVAVDDNVVATEDTPLNFPAASLLANDTDPDNDALDIILPSSTTSQGGTVGPLAPGPFGIITYTPPNNFTGTDTFIYVASDGSLHDTGLVTVQVNPSISSPTVTTAAASNVTGTSAMLNASANPNGAATTGWFRYSTTNPGTCNDIFGTRAPAAGGTNLGSGGSDVPFSQAISGLSPGTTYFYCAISQNSGGTSFGAVLQFTTPADPPSVTTSAETLVTSTGATLNGQANPNGGSATAWFRYSTTDPVTCDDTFGTRAPSTGGTSLGAGNGGVTFSRTITGLAAGTRYYFCAIVENSAGIRFGTVRSFTTSPIAPTVTTGAATAVTALTATLNGTANANGAGTTGWFRYATFNPGTCNDTFGTRAPATGGQSIGNSTNVAPISQAVSGLNPETTYFVCAIAQNSIGTGFGSVMQFTTPQLNVGLELSATDFNFGDLTVGATSAAQNLTITNTGTDPLILGSLSFADGTQYAFAQDPSGAVVQAGQSVVASITFSPTSLGLKTDSFTIPTNAFHTPTITLVGAGIMPEINVTPLAVDFETVSMFLGGVRQITISNTGSENLILTGVVNGPNAADFTTGLVDGSVVQPGTSTQVNIFFQPTGTGTRTASLSIGSNDADEPITLVNLTGVAVNPGFVQFSSASYSGNEGDGTITLTVQRVGGSQGAVSAFFSAGGGLATSGEACGGGVDYLNSIPFASFADGDSEPKTVLITVCDDELDEPTETFDINLFADGADMGANTNAIVAITDNDEAGQISISGRIAKSDGSGLTGHSVALAGTASDTTATDGTGAFSFDEISSGSYVVTPAADPSLLFDPISRNYPNRTTDVTDANFTAFAPGTEPRTLTVMNGFANPGQQALVPVVLVSQGDEAGLTFSLSYDPAVLSPPNVECGTGAGVGCSLTVNADTPGKIGISVDPVAPTFTAGSREVVRILFFTNPNAPAGSAPVTFTNDPATRETSDPDANPLLTRYVDGSVVFIHGIESDVAPRPNGDGGVSSVDVAQVRRFAVGLDAFDTESNEFQRADSAPYATAGDGRVAATDITQARRYQVGLDPTQPAAGPDTPIASIQADTLPMASLTNSEGASRAVRVASTYAGRSTQVTVALHVDAAGDENVYGFSLDYDPTVLESPVVAIGADAAGGNVLANTTQAGRVGFSVDFGSGVMPAGLGKQLVKITFIVSSTAPFGQSPITFSDTPAVRETSNLTAESLQTNYENGFVNIIGPTAANATISGRVVDLNGRGIPSVTVDAYRSNGELIRQARTNLFGYFKLFDLPAGEDYIVTVHSKRHRFQQPSKVLSLQDNLDGVNFIGMWLSSR